MRHEVDQVADRKGGVPDRRTNRTILIMAGLVIGAALIVLLGPYILALLALACRGI